MKKKLSFILEVVVLVQFANWFSQSAFASGLMHSTANLSQERYWLAATTVGNKAIFAGGFYTISDVFYYSNVVDIYDTNTDSWSTATLSRGRRELSATQVGNKAMFAGGYYGDPSGGHHYSNIVDIYDANTNTWSTATLSKGRDSLAAATVGNKALFAGGSDGHATDVVDIYDADTDTWSTAALSQARSHLAATTVGNKALFAGGGAYSDVVDIYNADTDTWSTATLSQGRTCMSATALGSKAFFAGGSIIGGKSNVVDIYDAGTDTWSTAKLSQPRHDLSATTVGNKALFAGGVDYGLSNIVDIYDADTDTWYTENLSQARAYPCATPVGIKALFAGGNAGGASSRVDIYTITKTLSIVKPNGGEAMLQGSTCDIVWESDWPLGNVLIEYSVNNGKDWESIVTTEDTGSYEWEINGPQSNQYLVRVSDVTDWYAFDISDSTFTVYTCQEEIHGDENGDCIVDMVDFAITAQNWLKKGYVRIFFSPLDSSHEWVMEGQWEFGTPTGNGGIENGNPDPISGYTGANVYGVNLNGDYTVAVGGPYCLTAGPFDCKKFHDMKLRFARWLNTDEPGYVASRIEVSNDGANWHNLWENTADITDINWQVVEYDAGETADNEATVYFRWSYEILDDRAYPYSGWNIDDIELLGKF